MEPLEDVARNWEAFGEEDPMWAILTGEEVKDGGWDVTEFFSTGSQHFNDIVMAHVDSLGAPRRFRAALDFGCGMGRLTNAMASRFDNVTGVDVAESMVQLATSHNKHPERVRFLVNKTRDLSMFPDSSFDLVFSYLVLQHMPPELSVRYIEEFVRVVAPGGLIVFQLPHAVRPVKGLDPDAIRGDLDIGDVPDVVDPGGNLPVEVSLGNRSDVEWENAGSGPVGIGNHWLDVDGNELQRDDARAYPRHPLAPGASAPLILDCTVPTEPGTYILEIDAVQEQVGWFATHGGQTVRREIRVQERALGNDGTVRKAGGGPTMEMHYVPRDDVVSALQRSGGAVLRVSDDDSVGDILLSSMYYASKRRRWFKVWR